MDVLTQSAFILAITSFALGATVLTKNVRNKLYLAFAGLSALITGWALSFFADQLWGPGFSYQVHLFFNLWLAPAALMLIQVFIRIKNRISKTIRNVAVLYSLFFTVALAFGLDEFPWVKLAIQLAPAFTLIEVLHLMWIDRRLLSGLKRLPKRPTVGFGRRNFIYFGALVAQSVALMDHFPWAGRYLPSIGNLILTIYLYFLSQAVLQQRLLNFGALISRVLVLGVFALTMTGIYAVLVAWVVDSPALFFLNSFIASFLVIMLLDPIRTLVGYFYQRLLTQAHLKVEQSLRESQMKLTGVVDPGSLFQIIIQTTENILKPNWIGFFLLRSDGTKFRRVRSVGKEPKGALRELLADHPILEESLRLRARGELPIVFDQVLENEIDRSTSATQREKWESLIQGLRALGGNLLIPLFDQNRVLGFLILDSEAPPEPWGSNWGFLNVIYPFYEQATHALRNLEVYVRQREKERLAALGEMAAGLAHEIRNPLGAIKGAAQYLDPSQNRPESVFLKVIVDETDRLNRVVTQFLDFSKPSSTDFQRVDLVPLVQKTVDLARLGLPENAAISFRTATPDARVLAVGEQIQQVVLNLIQNSIKAVSGRDAGQIEVQVFREQSNEGPEVKITVEDNGAGIKRENIEKIFIPFFTTSPSGTGLGLSICQKMIEAHRGRIEVISEEGVFTRFTVTLPLVTDEPQGESA